MQQKETTETFTPLELYGALKIEAVREVAAYVTLRNAARATNSPFEPKTVPHAILLAVELGGFRDRLAIWDKYPLLVEAVDELEHSVSPDAFFKKYGV